MTNSADRTSDKSGRLALLEDAIHAASNKILFLSDQDDLWVPDKVSTILQRFRDHPSVTLVASDAAPIDQHGNSIPRSYFADKGKFRAGLLANLIRNRYIGCTLAFRASVGSEFLPFPHKYDVLHDVRLKYGILSRAVKLCISIDLLSSIGGTQTL